MEAPLNAIAMDMLRLKVFVCIATLASFFFLAKRTLATTFLLHLSDLEATSVLQHCPGATTIDISLAKKKKVAQTMGTFADEIDFPRSNAPVF